MLHNYRHRRCSSNYSSLLRGIQCRHGIFHIFYTILKFVSVSFYAIIYSNTNSLRLFCENSSLNLANFTDRVIFCVTFFENFTPAQNYFSQVRPVPLVTNSMSASDLWYKNVMSERRVPTDVEFVTNVTTGICVKYLWAPVNPISPLPRKRIYP